MGDKRSGGFCIVVACIAAAGACEKNSDQQGTLRWGERRATQVVVGPHTIAIPNGWRDLAELKNEDAPKPSPGTAIITPEKITAGAMRSNIVFTWAPALDRADSCDVIARRVAERDTATVTKVETLKIDAEQGCYWRAESAKRITLQLIQYQGDHELVVNWTWGKDLGDIDASADKRVWDQIRGSLKFPASAKGV